MRGSRWYHQTMVKYCLEKNIIKSSDIKFQLLSGVKLKADYFNKFIEFISKKLVNDKDMLKLAVNGMIGNSSLKKRKTGHLYVLNKIPTMFSSFSEL